MIHQLIEIKFLFFCRVTFLNKKGLSPIVLRVTYREERTDIFTGMYCDPNTWNSSSQRVFGKDRTISIINKNLDDIAHRCKEKFEEMKYAGMPFILDQYIMNIKGNEQRPETILDYLGNKVDELKGRAGIDITAATVQKYTRCIKYIKEFLKQKYKNNDMTIASINNTFLMDFFYFLRTQKLNGHNSSLNYIKSLKTVLMPAIKNGILKNDPFSELKMAPKATMRGFLSVEEINQLSELKDLPPGISQALDIFLFACYTGMAYIDVKQFSRQHLTREVDGSLCIRKPRQKTGIISIIPLLAPAQRILESYSPTGDVMDFRWNVISNQKINEHLKTIAKIAEIKQELYFHLARHTFATTITLSNGIPLETVSRMLGHADIKMTQRYAKISGYKIKEDMKRLFGIFK